MYPDLIKKGSRPTKFTRTGPAWVLTKLGTDLLEPTREKPSFAQELDHVITVNGFG